MAVFFGTEHLPTFKNAVITIGSFDGVHHGHRTILKKVMDAANELEGESILITFEPHPRKVIHPEIPLGLLCSLQEKIHFVQDAGITHVVVIPFNRDFSLLCADEYVSDFLIKKFNPAKIIIGYDHHFGHDRKGNIETLKEMVPAPILIEEISAQLIEDAAVSSTKIRNAITSGHIEEANRMLGRPYQYEATVVHGNQIGRTIGYPTANLQSTSIDTLIPGVGVYAASIIIDGQTYYGMLSIGYRPTIGANLQMSTEINIFDFQQDIYGQTVTIIYHHYIRGEEKFDSLEALTSKIAEDEIAARTYFKMT